MTDNIKLFRMLLDNPLCTQLPAGWFRVWIVSLLLTNFRPVKWWNGSQEILIPAGSFVTSLPSLAKKSGVSVKILRTSLRYFERAGMMNPLGAYSGRHGFRHIGICKWESYQGQDESPIAAEGQVSAGDEGSIKGRLRAGLGQVKGTNVRSSVLGNPTLFSEEELQNQETHEVKNQAQELRIKQRIWFEEFWSRYWLKKARQDAEKAFCIHVITDELFQIVLKGRDAQLPEMMAREPSKRPYGATWINGKRWTDEVVTPAPAPVMASTRPITFSEAKQSRQDELFAKLIVYAVERRQSRSSKSTSTWQLPT